VPAASTCGRQRAGPRPEGTAGIRKSNRRWQSDVIVDLVKRYGFPYVALNPGASFRGLHDSLVNYGENDPPILLCNHEKIAVQIAHGYARASGQPMIAIVHDVVGLLHAPMGIYSAYLERPLADQALRAFRRHDQKFRQDARLVPRDARLPLLGRVLCREQEQHRRVL
jgi:Thiamine pyrophosphate enzyme, N-terminal TPP binding domain